MTRLSSDVNLPVSKGFGAVTQLTKGFASKILAAPAH